MARSLFVALLLLSLAACIERGATRDTLYADVTFPPGRTSFVRTYRVAIAIGSDETSARPREPVTFTAHVRVRMAELDVGARFPQMVLGMEEARSGAVSHRFEVYDASDETLELAISCGRQWGLCERDIDVSFERVDGLDAAVSFDLELRVKSAFRTRDEGYDETIRITEVAIP